MSAIVAAYLGMALLLAVSGFAAVQVRRGGLDVIMATGLLTNLAGVAVLWLRTDKPIEGPILLALGARHGVTVADLLIAVPALVAAGLLREPQRAEGR